VQGHTKLDSNQLNNVYELLPLDLPDAQAIKLLEDFDSEA
jgi:Ca2+-binding EF-hand superfamily protein